MAKKTDETQVFNPVLEADMWWKRDYPNHPAVWKIYEDFKVFLAMVWKHLNLPVPTPAQNDIAEYLQYGTKRRIIQGFRGVGKSYVTSAFVCWLLLRNPDLAIMVVSASKDRADAFSTFTKRLIKEMPLLQHLQAKEGQRDSNVAFDVGPARAKHSPSVKSVGIMGQLTGGRADVIIGDDVEVPNNSETQMQRDKIAERVKEFDAVLKPGGHVIYLGTPQTEQSLYNRLLERGYEARVWPSEIPSRDFYVRMKNKLAPYVINLVERTDYKWNDPIDPKRFSKEDLTERKLSYGASGYALQFLLDTSLSDAERYPLKLRDLIVMQLDKSKGPISVAWGPKREQMLNGVFTPGLDGDAFYGAAFVDKDYDAYSGSVMFVDPSGRGTDETSWAITKMLNGMIFVTKVVGIQGGYDDQVLKRIAADAKSHDVNLILVESNFGGGMFEKLLIPHLAAIDHRCSVEPQRAAGMKEARIIDTLEPVMNQHRLVFAESVIHEDDELVQCYRTEEAMRYRLFYQMTRITKDKGALANDDRLDALAGAVGYWVEQMALDQQKAAQKARDKHMEALMKEHFQNQVHDLKRPHRAHRRSSRDGSFVGF